MDTPIAKRQRIPPLTALRTFEVASRSRTFTEAAEDLNVTLGAVSRQIRLLEDSLQVSLFKRGPNRVYLTKQGDLLREYVTRAFSILSAATEKVRPSETDTIRLSCTTSIANLWLSRRIETLTNSKRGSIKLSVDASPIIRSLEAMEVDVAIRHVPKNKSHGPMSRKLLDEDFVAVSSQTYLNKNPIIKRASELTNKRLIHSPWCRGTGKESCSWIDWFSLMDCGNVDVTPILTFTGIGYAVQEILNNGGIMIASTGVCSDKLKEGQLVQVLGKDYTISSSHEYRIFWAEHANSSVAIQKFIDSLLACANRKPEFYS